MAVQHAPAPALRRHATRYSGFVERTQGPLRRREGPGADVVVVIAFEDDWLIDGERHTSFVGGLRATQVETEHAGRSYGMQLDLTPAGAYALFRRPLSEFAETVVPLDDDELVERLAEARDWSARFALLDDVLTSRLAGAPQWSREIDWAWTRLRESHGQVPVTSLATELGWSRKRLVARFRREIGLPPKTVARLLRFERARALALRADRPGWAEIAFDCGYYDQAHLINEFRAITGRAPETFLQDAAAAAP